MTDITASSKQIDVSLSKSPTGISGFTDYTDFTDYMLRKSWIFVNWIYVAN